MKRIPLVWQIIAGLVLGVLVGWYFNTHPQYQLWVSAEILKPLGDIFIKMMKMVVVPIVFCCMILGIAGGGDNKSFGRMGVKSLTYFFAITGLAIVMGSSIGRSRTDCRHLPDYRQRYHHPERAG